jgi:cyclic pyranopterin phosphate synthase
MSLQRPLADAYGRVATDLRVSLTDRCNLRCSYCMPAEGLEWLPHPEVLSDDEVVRLITIGVRRLGIREIRYTGGEPLIRRGFVDIVRRTRELGDDLQLSVTTNGLGLERTATALADAGLDRVNLSLDTLDPSRFRLAWAIAHEYELRFIEQMPLDAQHDWHRDQMVTADEIFERLGRDFTLTPASEPRGSSPAELFLVDGGPATVGVIASVTRPFCGDCDRVRLTADGQVRNCLFAREESDLRSPLRAGASDEELADRWLTAMASKLPGHGINDPTFLQPDRPMSAIGG